MFPQICTMGFAPYQIQTKVHIVLLLVLLEFISCEILAKDPLCKGNFSYSLIIHAKSCLVSGQTQMFLRYARTVGYNNTGYAFIPEVQTIP